MDATVDVGLSGGEVGVGIAVGSAVGGLPGAIAGVIVATLLYYAIDVKEDEGGRTEREGLKEWIHEILK